ncbi:LytR C-terminal domain-containing protein [Leifsonia sp. 2TAF2]|uniref:LytR C-terminal domain-containing protein n=1 Tax=Leifsonia sp. 2TAF2 TaxID=3233009 RepID=UPI003F9BC786
MAEKFPRDRFDEIPDDLKRVGAHRAPRPRGRAWIAVGWAALATVVLVGAGIFGLSVINGNLSFHGPSSSASRTPTPTPTPTPTIVPTVNPALNVNVLNGTATEGLAQTVGDKLTAAGWKVAALANADRTDLATTIVYYGDPANQAAALGVVQSLPGATIQQSTAFDDTGADITVVVGANYQG